MGRDYDAIVVGARCGGSPTAMLLARKGYRVLLVDKATFPSDTMSTHLVHPPAVAALALTHPQHRGQTYLLTGEQSLSQPEKVAALGAALDRTLSFVQAAPDEIRRGTLR